MKRILLLLLPFLPYLASAQVAKDTVTVLTIAQIPAGAIRDTTNLTFVQDNAFAKANFDSLAKYTRVKLIGDRGDITVSGSTGLTWELDAGVVDSMQLSAGAVVLPGAKVTGTLPVSKGGTGTGTQFTAGSVVFAGAGGVYSQNNSGLFWNNSNNRLGIGTATPTANLDISSNATTVFGTEINSSTSPPEIGFRKARGTVGNDSIVQVDDFLGSFGFYGRGVSAYSLGASIESQVELVGTNVYSNLSFKTRDPDLASFKTRMLIKGNGNVGIGIDSPAVQFHTTGGVRFATFAGGGTTTLSVDDAGNLLRSSTVEYKKNIEPIRYGLKEVMDLQPVNFNWIDEDRFGNVNENGFIAEDVMNVLPNVANADGNGVFMDYTKLIAVLTKAIQEQQAQIEQLKQRITQLENK